MVSAPGWHPSLGDPLSPSLNRNNSISPVSFTLPLPSFVIGQHARVRRRSRPHRSLLVFPNPSPALILCIDWKSGATAPLLPWSTPSSPAPGMVIHVVCGSCVCAVSLSSSPLLLVPSRPLDHPLLFFLTIARHLPLCGRSAQFRHLPHVIWPGIAAHI